MIPAHERGNWLRTAGLASLILAAAGLPFELKNPLLRRGPLGVTSAEIGIYLAIAIWGAGWLLDRWRSWTMMHTAVAAWGAAVALSALLAADNKTDALKFALRCLGGVALFFASSDLTRIPNSIAKVSAALVAGSCISAAAALAEIWLPGAADFLMRFKTQSSMSGSYLRASGTFQFANIASMYWEATLPLALSLSLSRSRDQAGRGWSWLGIGSSILLVEAILLSSSRASLVVAALTLIFLIITSRAETAPLRFPAAVSLFFLFALVCIHVLTDDLFRLRLTTRSPASWYSAEFKGFPADLTLEAGKLIRVPITVLNGGRMAWHAKGRQAVVVSYHWLDPAAEKILIWEGMRSEIPADVKPGATVKLEPRIKAPAQSGSYVLQWDMVQEKVAWFSVFSAGMAQMKVKVLPSPGLRVRQDFPPAIRLPLPSPPSRMDLWRSAIHLWQERPLFGIGPDNFRHLYGLRLRQKGFDDRIHSNSLYLETLATVGLAGALALMAVMLATALCLLGAWKGARPAKERFLVAGIAIALIAFYLHGLVDYFLPFTPTYGLFWILAGMAAGLRCAEKSL